MYEQNENPWNDPQDSQSQQEMYHRNPEPGNASNGLAVAALICSILPSGVMIFVGFALMVAHGYALGVEVAGFMLVLILSGITFI